VPAGAQPAVVERIVDGDTIEVRVDEPGALPAQATYDIRLLEIDTPETKKPGTPVQCFGPEATAFAKERLPVGSTVYLVADAEETDRYGRYLRYVFTVDGGFFNLQAVRRGYAEAVLYEPNDRYIQRMRAAEAEARAAERGQWGACGKGGPPGPVAGAGSGQGSDQGTANGPGGARGENGRCSPAYSGACVPPAPPDVDCSQLEASGFASVGDDPHRLDGDGDGTACEG
jgi:micrococcal nuclease